MTTFWLGQRFYELAGIWSAEYQVTLERHLWVVVMEQQEALGLSFPDGAIDAYRRVSRIGPVNLSGIQDRERVTRHDVKARIEEFNYLAGYECCHLGMTSADVVDNISVIKIRESLRYLVDRWPEVFNPLAIMIDELPFRGVKGAIGTLADQAELLGSVEKAEQLDRSVADRLGFKSLMTNVSQVYYRSLDLQVATEMQSLVLIARLRGGHWARHILAGYVSMIAGYAGETWNEGDVSTSVTRRVALPGLFLSAAALAGEINPPRFTDRVL